MAGPGEQINDRDVLADEPVVSLMEPEQTVAQELKDLESLGRWDEGTKEVVEKAEEKYDFPITVNRQVEYYLDFFQNRQRETFSRWLSRSGAYLPMIREHLKETGLPQDLAYLAMIESGFSQIAYSKARAVGMWQFIKATGRHYGLEINSYVDERRDPVKSTRAATAYLADLYEEFGSWYLAVAAYNAGEGKIRRAIRKHGSTSFWDLAQGRYLRLETKRYVPKLIAAIMIAKDPEKYGFVDIDYKSPLAYEIVEVPRWTSLRAVSLACGVKDDVIKSLNRELRKPFTPPTDSRYGIRVPVGKKTVAEKNLSRVQAIVTTQYKTHTVGKGDSLSGICRRYGLNKTVLLKANDLRTASLYNGQRLRVPYQTTRYELLPEGSVATRLIAADSSGGSLILHKVRSGETVSELARTYNVPMHLIAGWNDLKDISRIKVGQQIALYIQKPDEVVPLSITAETPVDKVKVPAVTAKVKKVPAAETSETQRPMVADSGPADDGGGWNTYYQVRYGDSLWTIARKYDLTVKQIKLWNNIDSNVIHSGKKLLLKPADNAGIKVASRVVNAYHLVRGGDSLWTIAREYNLSTKEIKRWNNLKSDIIHPGLRLRLQAAEDVDV